MAYGPETRPKIAALIRRNFAVKDRALLSWVTLRGEDGLGGFDLDVIQLVMDLEDEFCIEITDPEDEALRTVGDVFDLVEKKLGENV